MIAASCEQRTRGLLSSSTLKILACIFMAVDHIGFRIFPELMLLRVIGRLAFPLFAFFIAEGCRHTRHPWRRFFTIFGMGTVFFLVLYLYSGMVYANIFLTFSVSILLIYLLRLCKQMALRENPLWAVGALLLFSAALFAAYLLFDAVTFEYKFFGMLTPVLASLFDFHGLKVSPILQALDCKTTHVLCLGIGLLCISFGEILFHIQIWNLAALPLLLLYNERPGARRLKYGFYLFYPVHLVAIEGVYLLLEWLSKTR